MFGAGAALMILQHPHIPSHTKTPHHTCRRRAAHAARNQALNTEMSRQQHAFMLAFHRELDAALQEKGERVGAGVWVAACCRQM